MTTHLAACHCGAVQFRVQLTDGFNTRRRCTCSYCTMRGAVAVSAPLDGLEFIQGQHLLTLYQFKTKSAKHWFCSICGIYTHHQRRSNPHHLGINLACLAGISPFDFPQTPVLDGINHPTDANAAPRIAGTLHYTKKPPRA
jgi:hypothetical protein